MKEIDSHSIALLRFPLAIMVVFIHINPHIDGWSISNMENAHWGANFAGIIMLALSHVITHVSVPLFFLISGYLFFHNFDNGSNSFWKKKFSKRGCSILVPYIFWVLFYISKDIITKLIDGTCTINDIPNWIIGHGGIKILWCCEHWNDTRVDIWGNSLMATAPHSIPLWFLRDLIVMIAFTPMFYYALSPNMQGKIPLTTKLLMMILTFAYFTQTAIGIPGLNSSTLFYFCTGTFLAINKYSIAEVFKKYSKVSYLLFVVLTFVMIPLDGHRTETGNVLYPFLVTAGVVSVYTIATKVVRYSKFSEKMKELAPTTFFLYVFHSFILNYVTKCFDSFYRLIFRRYDIYSIDHVDKFWYFSLAEYFASAAITIAFCVFTYFILRKYFPKLATIVCGK